MFKSLNEIQTRIENYRSQMLVIAHQYDRQTWIDQFNHDPYTQLDSDLLRLNELLGNLQDAVEEKGAQSLRDACAMLRESGDSVTVSTLDYILESDYEEFVKIRETIAA